MKRKILLILSIAAVSTALAMTSPHAQNPDSAKDIGQIDHWKVKESKLPIVNFDAPEPRNTNDKAQRNARGKQFDGSLRVAEPDPGAGAKPILDSWMHSLPALPVQASDAIVVGVITKTEAYLSPDKTGVYTEYAVLVDEVLKQNATASILTGGFVDTQREGGRVRFPSGRMQTYIPHFQGVPTTGQKYVLFLKSNKQGDACYLLTGYELRERDVYPLDGVDLSPGATELPQFAAYKGMDKASFFKTLRSAAN